ncbi:hypothetical protein E2C01_090931 [Portunus trituberculatus]|uniref:Uncharacterized protein n=1 Tax=Portunus trituberculatus TaxID=210409 RepID=A0A5B7JRG1_PORTR|nr:hypothetical protein [Portunus trituberculatus]
MERFVCLGVPLRRQQFITCTVCGEPHNTKETIMTSHFMPHHSPSLLEWPGVKARSVSQSHNL